MPIRIIGKARDREEASVQDKMKKKKMLTGGQAKLDKNKNNRIDAEDFKILRSKKVAKADKGMMTELPPDPAKPMNPYGKTGRALGAGAKAARATKIGKIATGVAAVGLGAKALLDKALKKEKEKKEKTKAEKKAERLKQLKKEASMMGGGMMKKPMGYTKGGGADTGTVGEMKSTIGVAINRLKRRQQDMGRIRNLPKQQGPKSSTNTKANQRRSEQTRMMGGGMVGAMQKPMGYSKGKSVKVKCKIGRNRPTKMY